MIVLELRFNRVINNKISGVYLPTLIQVLATFLTFWFGFDTTSDRVTVGITCLLGVVSTFSEVKAGLPPTTNINSLDKWMVACILFITGQMIETMIVDFLFDRMKNQQLVKEQFALERKASVRKKGPRRGLNSSKVTPEDSAMEDFKDTFLRRRTRLERRLGELGGFVDEKLPNKRNVLSRFFGHYFGVEVDSHDPAYWPLKIDAFSRFLFPASFAAFMVYYWPSLFG